MTVASFVLCPSNGRAGYYSSAHIACTAALFNSIGVVGNTVAGVGARMAG